MIDLFTVVAQIINFLILILLLRRFLYKPVLKAVEARKNKIASEVQAAADLKAEAEKIKSAFELKTQEFDNERQTRLNEALEEAERVRKKRLSEIQQETEDLRNRLMRSFDDQRQAIQNQISRKAQEEVLAVTKKVLADLASLDLEEHIVNEFLQQLESSGKLSGESARGFEKTTPGSPVVIRTAFELKPHHQQRLAEVFRHKAETTAPKIEFEIKKTLVCGVEVQIGDYKLDWNLGGYLNAFQQNVNGENGGA